MNPKKAIRVLVVDDHEALRASLRQILALYADILPAAEAKNGRDALAACAKNQPDVVLMDMIMPGMDGIEAARRMRSAYPQIGIILWAFSFSPELAEQARASGANRVLAKIISPDDLARQIRAVSLQNNGLTTQGAGL